MLTTLSKLLSPVLCFTMDEVYQNIPYKKELHIVLEDMPSRSNEYDESVLKEFEAFKQVRNDVLKALEDARANSVIGSGQEADVTICFKTNKELFANYTLDELKLYFVVSKVTISETSVGNEYDNTYIEVKHHSGHKCERCWNYYDELIKVGDNYVCPRCFEVVKDVE